MNQRHRRNSRDLTISSDKDRSSCSDSPGEGDEVREDISDNVLQKELKCFHEAVTKFDEQLAEEFQYNSDSNYY